MINVGVVEKAVQKKTFYINTVLTPRASKD
jgi:hypothetical protein